MGNYRFRISDMMPNAWFYKLRDMGRPNRNPSIPHTMKKTTHPPRTTSSSSTPKPSPPSPKHSSYHPGRSSYYFPSRPDQKLPSSPVHPRASYTHFPIDPPRKSKKKARRRHVRPSTKLVSSSSSPGCSCQANLGGSVWMSESMPEVYSAALERPPYQHDDDHCDFDGLSCSDKPIIAENLDFDGSCSCRVVTSATDIIIDVGSKSSSARKSELTEDFHPVSELSLPPISTKPAKKEPTEPARLNGDRNVSSNEKSRHKPDSQTPLKEHQSPLRRSPLGIQQGLRMRSGSPRLASKKIQGSRSRKMAGSMPKTCLSESFAVVKSSADPQRDFRDSMVEMIVENNIRASNDLEELLACYLSLNSNEYHDVIVKVFEQIWFDLLTDIRLRTNSKT